MLDALVVGAPGGDGFLDLGGREVFGGGAACERGEFSVGGEAERDELAGGEGVNERVFRGWKQGGEAEALFEADDAVLVQGAIAAREAEQHEQGDGHDDTPEMETRVRGPVADGDVDGEAEIDQEDGSEEEVKGGVEACVACVALRFGHAEMVHRVR